MAKNLVASGVSAGDDEYDVEAYKEHKANWDKFFETGLEIVEALGEEALDAYVNAAYDIACPD